MAKVKFKTNLGSFAAESLGLKVSDCLNGSVAEVTDKEAAVLAEREYVEILAVPKPVVAEAKPVELKTDSPTPSVAKAKQPEVSKQGK